MDKPTKSIKAHFSEALISKSRILGALLIGLLCCVVVVTRLFYLQQVEHRFYATLSTKNLLNVMPLKPARGLIFDRNGVLLAKNIATYALSLIPEKITNLPQTIDKLKAIIAISEDDIDTFNRHRHQYRAFDSVPLKIGLSEEEMYRFYVNQHQFSGVIIEAKAERYYPLGDTTSEILGYVGIINSKELSSSKNYAATDNIGKTGIERYYENLLRGKSGIQEAEINASGHIVRNLTQTPPIAGKNLYLTIDSELQQKAHELLGDERGSVVAIKPDSGEVLALVSHPSFDPNLFIGGISRKNYQMLLNSPNHPLYNRAIAGQFAAGSTLKPFIALASLDDGIITTKSQIYDRGTFQLPNTEHIYHDWTRYGHGWVNVSKAIEVSCDTFFYSLAEQLGIKKLDDMLAQFGFGEKTMIDLPGEKSGLVPSPAWKRKARGTSWYTGDTIETAIGQGFFLVTPLQLASATASLANRGQHFQPHLMLKTLDENHHSEFQTPQLLEPPHVTQQWPWKVVIDAMQQVVDGRHGTGIFFGKNRGYTAAGKTGTAQIYGHSRDEYRSRMDIPKQLRNNHLFIAFAPVEHPQIALAVVVEHGYYADKIAGKLIQFYLNKQ